MDTDSTNLNGSSFNRGDSHGGLSGGAIVNRNSGASLSIDQLQGFNDPLGFGLNDGASSGTPTKRFSAAALLQFKWTILVVFLLVSIPITAAVMIFTVPKYKSTAAIRVRPIIPRLVFKTDDNGQIPFYESFLNTQVAILLSPTVLERVLEQQDVQKTAWYRQSDSASASSLERLSKDVTAGPRGRTEIVDVSVTTEKAGDAAVIVNAIIDQYSKFIREKSDQTDDLLYRKLTEEYNNLRNEIEGREKVAAKLRKELGTGSPAELVSQRKIRIDAMEARLDELHRSIATSEWQQKELAALVKKSSEKPGKATTQAKNNRPWFEGDAEWRRLYADMKTTQNQIEMEKDRLGETHPRMIDLNRRLKLAQEFVQAREAQLSLQWQLQPDQGAAGGEMGTNVMKDLHLLESRLRLMKYEEKLLVEDLRKQGNNFEKAFESSQLLAKEEETTRRTKELYDAVRSRLDQKEMERDIPGSIDILSRGYKASLPTQDRRILMVLMAILGGLGAGIMVAYIQSGPMIQDVEDVPATLRPPFLGQLPLLRGTERAGIADSPVQQEYIRMIRTALLQRLDNRHCNTIVVTSAGPKVGKTTVTIMLAKSLAQSGKKVLLVDADLRNPSVSRHFGYEADDGLATLLTSGITEDDGIIKAASSNFHILPAGGECGGIDPELLVNGAFHSCLERWRSRYNLILLDSPPVLPVADARILAQHADGSVMVIKEGLCRRNEVIDSFAYLAGAGAKLLGTIFIGSNHHGRYRSAYGSSYYNYGAMTTKETTLANEGPHTLDEMWANITYFLKAVVPAAEKAGVRLALHPNDPPAPISRKSQQIMGTVDGWKHLIEIVKSPSNGITFDCGVTREMGQDPVEVCGYFASRDRINHVHFRNVKVKKPYERYTEVFIDEGENNMFAVMKELVKHKYSHLIYPEHPRAIDYDRERGRIGGYPGGGAYAAFAFNVGYARAMMQAALTA